MCVSLCVVLVVVLVCNVRCVVCVVCGVCGVCGAVWHAEKKNRVYAQNLPVCRFKTPPCVPAKRSHVEHMRAFCWHTRRRFEPSHGDVLSIHTGRREGRRGGGGEWVGGWRGGGGERGEGGRGSLLSLPLLFSLPSLVFSLLSATMTMITRPVGSPCVHTALTCESVRVRGPWSSPCLANMFTL